MSLNFFRSVLPAMFRGKNSGFESSTERENTNLHPIYWVRTLTYWVDDLSNDLNCTGNGLQNSGFDSCKFDPLSSDLDLCILSTNEVETAVRIIGYQIAGLVQPTATSSAVILPTKSLKKPSGRIDKCRLGLGLVVEVTSCENMSLNEKLADGSNRKEFVMIILVNNPASSTCSSTDARGLYLSRV
ncbi:hypothetical protein HG530_010889 [Fusarium avenaceum]|nr:hypothetical protein HG530_010889 [Fusarium avenaceum]